MVATLPEKTASTEPAPDGRNGQAACGANTAIPCRRGPCDFNFNILSKNADAEFYC